MWLFRIAWSVKCQSAKLLAIYSVQITSVPGWTQERANASGLAREFCGWIFLWLGMLGERWSRFSQLSAEVKATICNTIPIQCLVVVWDSLKTNMAVLKGLRIAGVTKQQSEHNDGFLYPLISIRCGLHQIALCRKPLLFQFKGHYSSIVRLAHLFETHSFRKQFQRSLLRVISSSFMWIPVVELPRESFLWQEERNRASGILNDDPSYKSSRISWYNTLFKYDNGDPDSLAFTHYCTGECCLGVTPEEKKRFALVQIAKCYFNLFGNGYAVPLTYRWLKAHPALQYVKEGCLLHRILPRTLEQLSKGDPQSEEAESCAELFQDFGGEELGPKDDDRWEALLLQVINSDHLSPAEINQKRKQLTFESFRQETFAAKTILMEYLMSPLVRGMDELLKRTGDIAELHRLSESDTDRRATLVTRTGHFTQHSSLFLKLGRCKKHGSWWNH